MWSCYIANCPKTAVLLRLSSSPLTAFKFLSTHPASTRCQFSSFQTWVFKTKRSMATFSSIETAVTKITSWITLSLLSYFSGTVHSLIKLFCLIMLVVGNLSLGVFMIWQTWFLALHICCLVLVLSHSVEVGNIIIFIFSDKEII